MKIKDLILDRLEIPVSVFSAEVGLSRQTIINILNESAKPSLPTVKKICKYFNVDFRDYL